MDIIILMEEIEETEKGVVEIEMIKKEVRKEERVLALVHLQEEDHHLHLLLPKETSPNLLHLLVLITQRAEEVVEVQNQIIQITPNQNLIQSQNLSQKNQRVRTPILNKKKILFILKYV